MGRSVWQPEGGPAGKDVRTLGAIEILDNRDSYVFLGESILYAL